jgi:hypothetical protein
VVLLVSLLVSSFANYLTPTTCSKALASADGEVNV